MSVETATSLQTPMAVLSHCSQQAKDLQYGCQRMCCHLNVLSMGSSWTVLPLGEGLPLVNTLNHIIFLTAKSIKTPFDPGPMAWSN